MINLEVKMTIQDYTKLNFLLTYKKPLMIFMQLMGLVCLLVFFVLKFSGKALQPEIDPTTIVCFGLIFTFFTPLSIYNNSKKIYHINKYLQESVLWSIDENRIKLKGQTFEGEYEWSNIYEIHKLKDWTIIYKDNIVANFITNKSFQSSSDYEAFWKLAKLNQIRIK